MQKFVCLSTPNISSLLSVYQKKGLICLFSFGIPKIEPSLSDRMLEIKSYCRIELPIIYSIATQNHFYKMTDSFWARIRNSHTSKSIYFLQIMVDVLLSIYALGILRIQPINSLFNFRLYTMNLSGMHLFFLSVLYDLFYIFLYNHYNDTK